MEVTDHSTSCPNTKYLSNLNNFAQVIRKNVNSGTISGEKLLSCGKDMANQMTTENFLMKIKINTE